jgi:protein-S-isoprenylcysteine O-methyltransferase Ste14
MSQDKVDDLIEKFQKGELTSKQAYAELKKRGLVEHERRDLIFYITYFVLWLLPGLASYINPDFLSFFSELRSYNFPTVVIYISIVLVAIGTFLLIWGSVYHRRRGGLRMAGETLVFYREGPFRVIRHPGVLGGMMWFFLLPIILSRFVPFTILSIAAILVMAGLCFFEIPAEERLSIVKWGDEYRRYKKEVPGFNIFLGLWRLRK